MSQQKGPAMMWLGQPSRPDLTRWIGSIVCALLVHVGAAAAVILDLDFGTAEPLAPPLAAMTVELAALAAAPEKKVTQIPPGPEQVEQKAQPKPTKTARLFDPPPEIKTPPPDALPLREEEEPQPEQVAAAERTTDTPSSLAEEQDQLKAPLEGAPSESASSATQTWENQLLTHLEHYKQYPAAARQRRQEDIIYLRFTMDRTGKVLNWAIQRSRGYALLDREVDALIQRASPLPPPPEEVTGSAIEMVVPVEFFLRRNFAQAGAR